MELEAVIPPPSASPPPAASPGRPPHHANAKRNGQSYGIVSHRRIVNGWVGIDWSAVHYDRIIGRYIHNLWISLFDHDYVFALDDLGFHLLLLGRFQVASVLCLLAHALHGIQHIALLSQERVA